MSLSIKPPRPSVQWLGEPELAFAGGLTHIDPTALTGADSSTAMSRSLRADAAPRVLLAPTILTNAVGIDTVAARATACHELQPGGSEKHTRHIEVSLPPGVRYRAGDHLGVCPRNDEERVERLAQIAECSLPIDPLAPAALH